MSCELTIVGKNLNIDVLVSKTKIEGFEKSYAGEPISSVSSRLRPHSIARLTISNASFDDLPSQIKDAENFLRMHKQNLRHIKSNTDVEVASIDFGITSKIGVQNLTQRLYFPQKLIAICGQLGIGIEASLYRKKMGKILEERHERNANKPAK